MLIQKQMWYRNHVQLHPRHASTQPPPTYLAASSHMTTLIKLTTNNPIDAVSLTYLVSLWHVRSTQLAEASTSVRCIRCSFVTQYRNTRNIYYIRRDMFFFFFIFLFFIFFCGNVTYLRRFYLSSVGPALSPAELIATLLVKHNRPIFLPSRI